MDDGTTKETMGTAARDLLGEIKKGNQLALDVIKQDGNVEQKFQIDKFDLVAWLLVNGWTRIRGITRIARIFLDFESD